MQRAALIGLSRNGTVPWADRMAMAQQVIRGLEQELQTTRERLGQCSVAQTAAQWWKTLLADLDRCPHGRHEGDVCSGWRGPGRFDGGCQGGVSLGNPWVEHHNGVLGVDLHRRVIRVPQRADKGDLAAWKRGPVMRVEDLPPGVN